MSVYNIYTVCAINQNFWAWDGRAVGARIKEARERLGLSVRQLALKTNGAVSYSYISQLELGKMPRPGREKIIALFEAMGINLEADLGGPIEPGDQGDPTIESINVNLLTIRDLDPSELAMVQDVVAALAERLKRRRKEREAREARGE